MKWQEAIDSELKSIAENEVSEVVQKVDQKTIQTWLIFKTKKDSVRFKARLVWLRLLKH